MPQLTTPTFTVYRMVVKSDSVDVEKINDRWPTALQCGETGIVQVVSEDGRVIPFTVAVGQILPVTFRRVNSGSTAGTLFVALWQV